MCSKVRTCDKCFKKIKIKPSHSGTFWHLNQWENKHGVLFTGGYCLKCFNLLNK